MLTAFHVVESSRDSVIGIRVEQGQPTWRRNCRVVWKDKALDVALIEANPPLAADIPPVVWNDILPEHNVTWVSTAYPRAAVRKEDGETDYKTAGIQGLLYVGGGGGQGQRELDLGVTNRPKMEDWQGASGAPVFVEGSLIGLLKSTGWNGERFQGTPAAALRQDTTFRLETAPSWVSLPTTDDWVLALRSEAGGDDFVELISKSIERHGELITRMTGKRLNAHSVIEIRIDDALETPERWLRLAEALCVAPFMIADVTGLEPGTMLSLGVRAVVRRGITIASTGDTLDETILATLPFNIQETKLISHGRSSENPISRDSRHPLNMIARTLLNGILEQQRNPRYLDLPAYDAVRCPPPDVTGRLDAWESILALCSFRKEYAQHWQELLGALALEFPAGGVVRMRDIDSPRLVGQALYEQIRWTKLCVVDWTHWRPNVFFELGVRLASSRFEPVSLLEDGEAEMASPQQKKLISLFQPARYLAGQPKPVVKVAIAAYRDEQMVASDLKKPRPRNDHRVPFNGTYNVCLAKFDHRQERGTLPPHDFLRLSNEAVLGKDRQRAGDIPTLFAASTGFSAALERSARERWIAAWLYLSNRHSERALLADAALFDELKRLGESLLQELKDVTGDPFIEELRGRVLDLIDSGDEPNPERVGG